MVIRGDVGGWWEGINVPDEQCIYVTEHVAAVNMLHMLSYVYQGECINVPDE